jgi:hypothetical protein
MLNIVISDINTLYYKAENEFKKSSLNKLLRQPMKTFYSAKANAENVCGVSLWPVNFWVTLRVAVHKAKQSANKILFGWNGPTPLKQLLAAVFPVGGIGALLYLMDYYSTT